MAEPYLQVGVKLLLKNKAGLYLLTRRNPKKYPEIGPRWDIIGGRINPGLSLLENLSREISEEVGLTSFSQPTLIAAQDILAIPEYPGRHVVRLTYLADQEQAEEIKIDEESLEYQWLSEDEIKKIPTTEINIYLKELLDRQVIFP